MPPVKRQVAAPLNPIQERLLTLAALIAPPGEKPNLAYLERRTELTVGTLKDAGRRASISRGLAATLLRAAPRIGVAGLTSDWLVHGRGDPPYKSGDLPLVVRENRGGYGADASDVDEDAAYLAYTLDALRALSTVEREKLGAVAQLELLEEVEKIGARFGQRAKDFIERQRQRIQRGETLGADGNP